MSEQLSSTFQAIADPARRAILAHLACGPTMVGELAQPLTMTAPAVSHHLKVLERAELVTRRTRGQHRLITLNPQKLSEAAAWLDELKRFWGESFDRLDAELAARSAATDGGDDD